MSQMSLDPVKNFLLENSSPCDRWEELTEAQLTNFTQRMASLEVPVIQLEMPPHQARSWSSRKLT